MRRRRSLALGLGIALPVLLLALGWLFASVREHEAREREQTMLLERSGEAIRAAVDESLDELRKREDARPFYLYNHFYSPPEVLALNDPVAVSPLAAEPDDARVVGYFQIDPGGTVRTPYQADLSAEPGERASAIIDRVRAEGIEPIRTLAFGPSSPLLPTIEGKLASRPPEDGYRVGEDATDDNQPARYKATTGKRSGTYYQRDRKKAEQKDAQNELDDLSKIGSIVQGYNSWSNTVQRDLTEAQAGDEVANMRVQSRGRSAPVTTRNDMSWDEALAKKQRTLESKLPGHSGEGEEQASRTQDEAVILGIPVESTVSTPEKEAEKKLGRRRRKRAHQAKKRRLAEAKLEPDVDAREDDEKTDAVHALPTPLETAVDYTSMVYRDLGEELVLYRVVTDADSGSVQGVLLDREHLIDSWLPAVIERHAVAGSVPTLRSGGSTNDCALALPASTLLEGMSLCFATEPLAAARVQMQESLYLQGAALAGLLAVVALAVWVVARVGRQSDQLSAQKSAFVSAVSHELRTPLTTIRMHAEMLRDDMVSSGKRQSFYDDLVGESVRLSRLVENVLGVARLEEGRRVVRPRSGDLAGHVRRVVGEQTRLLESSGFELELDLPEASLELAFDSQAVEQIVVNLLENAVKYASQGDEKRVTVALEATGNRVELRVEDRGPGIPEAERDEVFQRFYRVERADTAHTPGTGLGLTLVRELARAHGGDADVLVREGGGTIVRVWLPLG